MPLAVIRADANSRIGAGHLVRCQALALALKRRGWRIALATAESTPALLFANAWDEEIRLPGSAADEPAAMASRWPAGADLLILDHYERDVGYERRCRPWARRLTVIDDGPGRTHDADWLVDATADPESAGPISAVQSGCRLRFGPSFALIRPEIVAARPRSLARSRGHLGRVLVSLGATDPQNLTLWVLDALNEADLGVEVDVVLSRSALHLAEVERRVASLPRVRLHVEPADLPALIVAADLAIGSGGVSMWERCCLGIPSIVIVVAANQQGQSSLAESRGAAHLLNSFQPADKPVLVRAVRDFKSEPRRLEAMMAAAASLCDGGGAERLAAELDSEIR